MQLRYAPMEFTLGLFEFFTDYISSVVYKEDIDKKTLAYVSEMCPMELDELARQDIPVLVAEIVKSGDKVKLARTLRYVAISASRLASALEADETPVPPKQSIIKGLLSWLSWK